MARRLQVAPGTLARPSGRRGPLLVSAAAFNLGGAAVYLAVLPGHLQANLAQGIFFATAGTAQAALAVAPLADPTRRRCCSRCSSPSLAMDVYEPAAGAARPAPAVLCVHGGGFVFGDRKPNGLCASLGNHAGALLPQLRTGLNQRGMVVASIDFRLPPLSPWPAALEDAKCAVRFLRAHAGVLGTDPRPGRQDGHRLLHLLTGEG